jgi:2-oxoglutarate ferredoxin oxidoreductase subunit gamma
MELRFAGTGGQGLVKAAAVLAHALGIEANYEVVQTQFYSGQISGGPSCGDVVLGDAPIEYPWVMHPDILVAMSQPSVYDHSANVVPGAKVLVDDIMVTDVATIPPGVEIYWAPFTRLGDEAGFRKAANVAALGLFASFSGLLSYEQIEQAVTKLAPGNRKINLAALRLGYDTRPTPHLRKVGEASAYVAPAFRGV